MIKRNKIIILGVLMIFIFMLSGCNQDSEQAQSTTQETTLEETTTQELSEPNPVGLYLKNKELGTYELINQYEINWAAEKDTKYLKTFASNESSISADTYGNLWRACWNDHPDATISKVGYKLDIMLIDGQTITRTITRPSDTVGDYNEYIEVWMYDDIYNEGVSWYSHLTEADFTENSLCTSIKLTAAEKIQEVNQLKLTTFIYDGEEDFDQETGEYIGKNYHEVNILGID